MSTQRQEPPLNTTAMAHTRSESMTKSHPLSNGPLPANAPIEPGHSLSTGMEMVTGQVEEDHKDSDDDYGHQFVLKRLRKDLPLPGRWTMMGMLFTLFLVMFLAGWNDASQGPLLPSLQSYYDVNYTIISTIWVANFGGFIAAGIVNVLLTDRLGFGIVCPIGAFAQAVGYALMCWGGPFVLFVLAYIPNGFGLGLQDAQVNSVTARLENAQTKMFLMHAIYGFGATVSPLVSTEFVKQLSGTVYYYFAVSLGLALFTSLALFLVFRLRTEDQVVGRRGIDETTSEEVAAPQPEPYGESSGEKRDRESKERREAGSSGNKMKRIMKTPAVHFMAFYIMIYVGVEVTIGGWATTFILNERGGDSNAGYVTTGYFAGLTLGRIILIPVTNWLGNGNSIYIFTILAMALELVIWFTDSIPGNAVCFALVGIFLGPCYPIVVMTVVDVIPPELQGGSIGWLASLGQGGSAIMPFITGAISNHYGIWILQPLVFAFLGLSLVLWAFVVMPRWGLGNPEKIKPIIATGTMAESGSGSDLRGPEQGERTLSETSASVGEKVRS